MKHIIDGNNLAGKLEILDRENFDQEIIDIVKEFSIRKEKEVILVFDSTDPMGDKYEEENVTIVYTPRDNYYQGADDKIIEELENCLQEEKTQFCVVTNDMNLIDRVDELAESHSADVDIYKTTDFILELDVKEDEYKENNDKLSVEDEEEINEELMNIWS